MNSPGPSPSKCGHASRKSDKPLLAALRQLIKTREIQETIGVLIADLIQLWAGDTALKKGVARQVGKRIRNGLSPDRSEAPPTQAHLGEAMANLLDSLLVLLETKIETLSVAERETRLKEMLARIFTGDSGPLFTLVMQALKEIHAQHPTVLAEAITPAIHSWVTQTDFGALREAADNMGPEIDALAEGINDILWQYPAKLLLLLSFCPDLVNSSMDVLTRTLAKFNQAAPDLIADIVFSLIRDVNGTSLGKAFNQLSEVTRKIHTGSTLIGGPGNPQFQYEMQRKMPEIIAQIDSRTYWQARIALSEKREIITRSLLDAQTETPEFQIEGLATLDARKNPAIRTQRHRLESLSEIPDDGISTALDRGLSNLDLQEVSDIVNLTCGLINRVIALRPELVRGLVDQLVGGLDMIEIETVLRRLFEESAPSLRPVLRAALPDMIDLLCQALAPADDEYEARMAKARRQMRALFTDAEVTP